MSTTDLITSLRGILEPYVQNKEAFEQLNEETDFIKDLEINSANLVDVVLDVEDAFDIEIDDDSMAQMLTVKSALTIIKAKLEAK